MISDRLERLVEEMVDKSVQFEEMTGRENQFGFYVSDRWQVNEKLTLNLGLRYEYVPFEDAVNEFEKRFITRVLRHCDGSLTKTADALGMHRNTLTRKMTEYKIKRR